MTGELNAARLLEIDRVTFYNKIKYGFNREEKQAAGQACAALVTVRAGE